MAVKKIQMYRRNLDGTETNLNPLTESQHVLMENGQTVQEILSDRDSDKYTPVITNSSSTFKVGQGDSVDLSSSIKEGAYDSCVLKGRTLVNCIQEPSSQDVVLPYEFTEGQYVTIDDTKESGALGVELKGQTLVNLLDYTKATINNTDFKKDGDTITVTALRDIIWYSRSIPLNGMVVGKKYIATWESLNYTTSAGIWMILGVFAYDSSNKQLTVATTGRDHSTNHIIFTVPSNADLSKGVWFRIHATTTLIEKGAVTAVKGSKVFEYKEGMENWDIPYFEGMASVKAPTVTTCQQLFDYSLVKRPFVPEGGNLLFTNDGRIIRADYRVNRDLAQLTEITIPQGNYTISFEARGNLSSVSNMDTINVSKLGLAFVGDSNTGWSGNAPRVEVKYIDLSQTEFTKVSRSFTFDESKKVTIFYHGWNDKPVGWCEFKNIRITPQGKTSSLTLPNEVILRSLPNGVCDTFNTRTGEYVRRIEEIVFNGSEDIAWSPSGYSSASHYAFFTRSVNGAKNAITKVYCDKLPSVGSLYEAQQNREGCMISSDGRGHGNFWIKLSSQKIENNVSSLKDYLKQNPITIQYELETPIITIINLSSTLKSWNTITHIYSEIPENSLYPILSHSNPTYPVILKPSTKYSIVANSYSNNHTNSAINFNLGGATASTTVGNRVTTVTTPSTLENGLLTMSGRGNKLNHVMVIEGEVVGDEPYFEGICDVKSPVVKNVGKNLFDLNGEWVKCVYAYGVPQVLLSHSGTIAISNNGFSITTQTNNYNRGFGQYINVSSLDTLYVKATAIYTDTKTVPELKIIGLYENESILASINSTNSSDYQVITKKFSSEQEVSFDLDVRSYSKIFIMFSGGWKSEMSGSYTFTMKNVYIGGSNQTCEPHKSNTTTFNQKDGKTIVLRSLPNGVCDTLNVETGEYVQRIRGKVFDGKDNGWQVLPYPPHDNDTHYQFKYWFGENLIGGDLWNNAQSILANTLPSASGVLHWSSQGKYGIGGDRSHFMITWEKSSSPFHDVATLNAWLQANPITVQYQLATPIVSTVDVQGFPYAYTNGHVQLSSGYNGQSLTPKVEYSLSANKTGQINSNSKIVMKHQKQLDDFEAMMLTSMVQSAYDKAILQFDYEMRMMSLGGE